MEAEQLLELMEETSTRHGLDPRAYRDRYGLPADYPMVASEYAARRSALAKTLGLGSLRSAH